MIKEDYQNLPDGCGSTAMWSEGGMDFRSDIRTKVGGSIEYHKHDFSHMTLIMAGWWLVKKKYNDGRVEELQLAPAGFKPTRTEIEFKPSGNRIFTEQDIDHEVTVLELQNGVAESLCVSPDFSKKI